MLPTASKTGLLLQCGRPFWTELKIPKQEVGEAAVYGTAYHLEMANLLTAMPDVDGLVGGSDAQNHACRTYGPLLSWLRASTNVNWTETPKQWVETSFLFNTDTGKARITELDLATHTYFGHGRHEIGVTVDYAAYDPVSKTLLVLDHKTGEDPGDPENAPQLFTQSLALTAFLGGKFNRIIQAFHHAPRFGTAKVTAKTIGLPRVKLHHTDLTAAFAEITKHTLRPGPECGYCPARLDCPTVVSALATLDPQGPGAITSDRAGQIHQALALYDDLARQLKAQLREYVQANGPVIRPDGKVVDFTTRPFSNLSMASIRRALPPEEAEALIDNLAAKGCIESGDRVELRASKAPK